MQLCSVKWGTVNNALDVVFKLFFTLTNSHFKYNLGSIHESRETQLDKTMTCRKLVIFGKLAFALVEYLFREIMHRSTFNFACKCLGKM